jgi:alkyl sulfatase BDS1-like metallo-beta-lactamase superfamily hydrolase
MDVHTARPGTLTKKVRIMLRQIRRAGFAALLGGFAAAIAPGFAEQTGPNPATSHTRAVNAQHRASLPFSDTQDFADADRGFVAGPSP